MNITIHRGANQIGGCITEISSDNCKLLIDFGSNLPGNQKAELTEKQICDIAGSADALLVLPHFGQCVYRSAPGTKKGIYVSSGGAASRQL